jgi:predicted alpha/beta hydrolase
VLAISFSADKLAPQNAVKILTTKMQNAAVKYFHYENHDLNHFNWVKKNDKVVASIENWLAQAD